MRSIFKHADKLNDIHYALAADSCGFMSPKAAGSKKLTTPSHATTKCRAHNSEAVWMNSHPKPTKLRHSAYPPHLERHIRLPMLLGFLRTYLRDCIIYLRMPPPLHPNKLSNQRGTNIGTLKLAHPGCSGLLPGRMTLSTAQPAACCVRNSFSSCCDQTVTKVHMNQIAHKKTHVRTETIVSSAILRPKLNSHCGAWYA